MPLIINAIDTEFAISTGSNINSGSGTSSFDYPPTTSTDLVITANAGDPSPGTFEIGDTYDLSFDGMAGTRTIEDAVVLRSDPISVGGSSGHAVVFEGTDDNGDLVQLVWTPGFDLEGWYSDNFNSGSSPGFYNADMNPSANYAFVCFTPGTRIAVPGDTRPVEDLRVGDLVSTRDHEAQPLIWTGRRCVWGGGRAAPVLFEPGTVGNSAALRLSPQHRLLMAGDEVELHFGVPEVLIPAVAFVGQPGVRREEVFKVTYLHLLFDRHELIAAEGAVCESLFLGGSARAALSPPADPATAEATGIMPEIPAMHDRFGMRAARPVLRAFEAAALFGTAPIAGSSPAMV